MRRALAVLPLLAALALSACAPARAAHPVAAPVVGATPTAAPPGEPDAEAVTDAEGDPGEVVVVDATPDPDRVALEAVWLAPPPRGTGVEVALRFLQALQRGDDLAAERQLAYPTRFELSPADLAHLHEVMSDVRRNAGLGTAGPCSRALALSDQAVVATCGRLHVVLNVGSQHRPGIDISDWTTHYDVFHGPHMHAYTTLVI